MGCHFLLQCMKVKSESEIAQSCPTQRPHGLQPTRFLRPCNFPGKSTGVGRHCLLRLSNKEEADRGHGGASCPFSMKRNASHQRTMPVSTPIPLAPKPSFQLSFGGRPKNCRLERRVMWPSRGRSRNPGDPVDPITKRWALGYWVSIPWSRRRWKFP